jgi:hypothetical protein
MRADLTREVNVLATVTTLLDQELSLGQGRLVLREHAGMVVF